MNYTAIIFLRIILEVYTIYIASIENIEITI